MHGNLTEKHTTTLIDQVIRMFEAGDPAIMTLIADKIDFRIDHYQDDADVSWQSASTLREFGDLLSRLASEIFPRGTKIISLETEDLGNGWSLTRFKQRFYYGLWEQTADSATLIISHETDGKIDFFRETVTTVERV